MRNAGKLVMGGPNGVQEFDTKHCVHCNGLIPFKTVYDGATPRKVYEGRYCQPCGAFRCSRAACQVCIPFKRQVDAKHKADRMFAALGIR